MSGWTGCSRSGCCLFDVEVSLSHALAEPSGAIFFCAFAGKKRPLRFGLCGVYGLRKFLFTVTVRFIDTQKCSRRKRRMDDDMAGGPTRTLARSGSERRPSRRGVNTSHQTEPAWRKHFTHKVKQPAVAPTNNRRHHTPAACAHSYGYVQPGRQTTHGHRRGKTPPNCIPDTKCIHLSAVHHPVPVYEPHRQNDQQPKTQTG